VSLRSGVNSMAKPLGARQSALSSRTFADSVLPILNAFRRLQCGIAVLLANRMHHVLGAAPPPDSLGEKRL